MIFPEKIKSINRSDLVLEVGPGENPYSRSDVFLEKRFNDRGEYQKQIGYAKEHKVNKSIIYYDGGIFPFKDKEFDYVICSHVLEHVDDVEFFLSEITRVGRGGYLEFPTIYYDYLYNFSVHKNLLFFDGQTVRWLKKKDTPIDAFQPVNDFFYETLKKNYDTLVFSLRNFFFQGFEWSGNIGCSRVEQINDLCLTSEQLEKLLRPQGKFSKYLYFFEKLDHYLKVRYKC